MRQATALASRVVEGICGMPGVPTQDWCHRAAGSLVCVHGPSVAMVGLCELDARGFVESVLMVGSAVSAEGWWGRGVEGVDRAAGARQVERGLRVGEWLGWSTGGLGGGEARVSAASSQGLLGAGGGGGGGGEFARRWGWLGAREGLLGAVRYAGGEVSRAVVVELAVAGEGVVQTERWCTVLEAALPVLARRAVRAFGSGAFDRAGLLTAREEHVLWRLVAGDRVPRIAAELGRSVYTVHDHVKSLHRKLGASSRGGLVARTLGHMGPEAPAGGAGAGREHERAAVGEGGLERAGVGGAGLNGSGG